MGPADTTCSLLVIMLMDLKKLWMFALKRFTQSLNSDFQVGHEKFSLDLTPHPILFLYDKKNICCTEIHDSGQQRILLEAAVIGGQSFILHTLKFTQCQ